MTTKSKSQAGFLRTLLIAGGLALSMIGAQMLGERDAFASTTSPANQLQQQQQVPQRQMQTVTNSRSSG